MFGAQSHEEEEDSSSPTDSRRVDRKSNKSRSKHSETEQRRRSKINERFQTLRDLIPESDQKRDKASFLLEVIQYIQFLHDRLQMFEGSCQGWSPETTKFTPWNTNSGRVESFIDQSQLERKLSCHEDNILLNSALLSNAQNSVESDLTGDGFYKQRDDPSFSTNPSLLLNLPLQAPMFANVPGQLHQGSFDAEQLTLQSQSHLWPGRSCGDDCSVPVYSANEDLNHESEEASIPSVYSQRLLNSLSSSLQSSGVDLSQASISVELDVGKQGGRIVNALFNGKDHKNASGLDYKCPVNFSEKYGHPHKRFRADRT